MRKNKKFVMLILLLLSVFCFPLHTFAEESRTEVRIRPPVVGNQFSDMINSSYCNEYNLSLELYNNTDKVVVLEGTKIKANKDYTLKVRLDALDDNVLPENLEVVLSEYDYSDFYVDKTEPIKTSTSYEFQIHYNTRLEKTKIYGPIQFDDFGKIYVGKNIEYKVVNPKDPSKKHYTVTQGWYEEGSDEKLTESDTFKANTAYEYHVKVDAKEGYTFSDYIYSVDNAGITQSGYFVNLTESARNSNTVEWVFHYDTTQEENKVYGPVELEAPTLRLGEEIKPIVSKDERYTVSGNWTYFEDGETKEVQEGEVFDANKRYHYDITIVPNEGYTVEDGLEIVLVNLPSNPNIQFYNNTYAPSADLYVDFHDKSIEHLALNISDATPKIGKKPVEIRAYTYTNGEEAPLEVTSQVWYVGSTVMGANDLFAKDRTYKLVLTLETKDDYVFSDYLKNNLSEFYYGDFYVENDIKEFTGKKIVVEYTFNTEYKDNYIYDSLNLNVNAPSIGGTPSYANILSTDYSISSQYWYNETDNKKMTAQDKFEKDKVYSYSLALAPANGKFFSSEFRIESNLENSPYYDKDSRMAGFMGGLGAGSTSFDDNVYYGGTFILSDKIDDEDYLMGYISVDPFVNLPKAGENVSYAVNDNDLGNEYKEKGLTIEKGWYKKGTDKILTESDVFEPNTTYEFHLRYLPVAGKKVLPGLLVYREDSYLNYLRNPYFKESERINGDNYLEVVLTFEMGAKPYEEDNTIIKVIPLDEQAPVIGEKPVNNLTQETENYTITDSWKKPDYYTGNLMDFEEDEVFELNNNYLHTFKVTAKSGYVFSDNLKFDLPINKEVYCEYLADENAYECQIYYQLYNDGTDDENEGYFEFKDSEYYYNSNYVIPSGVDSFSLEVARKSGEYDLDFFYYNSDNYVDEPLEYEINGDIVTISNINNFRAANPEMDNVSFYVRVDANDQYDATYENYHIRFNNSKVVTLPTITNYEGNYDGEEHTITVEGGEGGTLLYRLENEETWQTELPLVSKVGTTKIFVKVDPAEGYTALLPTYGLVKIYGASASYEVTFKSNDDNNQTKKQSVVENEPTALSKNTFVREGYVFTGWNTKADGSGTAYEDEKEITISADLTLYAQWEKEPTPITNISLNETEISLTVGQDDTKVLKATLEPSNTTQDTTVTWTSSNASIAKVNQSGKVTAVAKGEAVITATTSNGLTATCNVVVNGRTGWVTENGAKYYYEDGEMQKGITEIDGNRYLLGITSGKLYTGGLATITDGDDAGTYYTDKNGIVQTGQHKIGNDTYYFDETGKMQKGIIDVDGDKYLYGVSSGKLYTSGLATITYGEQEGTYYTDKNGVVQTGQQSINGETYYFDPETGKMLKGIIQVGENKYLYGVSSGKLYTGGLATITYGEQEGTYYTDENGVVQTGQQTIGNDTYYFDPETGKMLKGIIQVGENKYLYGVSSGKLYRDGLATITYGDQAGTYITDEEGIVQTGWIDYKEEKYYSKEDGKLVKGVQQIGEESYLFGVNSFKLYYGLASTPDGKTYYSNEEGVLQKGTFTIDGQDYTFGEDYSQVK